MKLLVVHYHLRPGGIRRVIEIAVPALLGTLRPQIDGVWMVNGESTDPAWMNAFRAAIPGVPVEEISDPALGYFSEWTQSAEAHAAALEQALAAIFARLKGEPAIVWMHNASVARNIGLTRALTTRCVAEGVPLVLHQHDWWFDNRWSRWSEFKEAGLRTIKDAATAIFPSGESIRHLAINRQDAAVLESCLGKSAAWMPNPIADDVPAEPARVARAKAWLRERTGGHSRPIWILPCRLLRRKNVAEALLLTRLLRPEAVLITTGAASSRDEQPYAAHLGAAASAAGWPLQLGVLAGGERDAPCVEELIVASEAVLLTSLQEGFGLPYLEAAFGDRPLIARMLHNVAPDLQSFGLRFPQLYEELWVDAALFDWKMERARQRVHYSAWKKSMPAPLRAWVELPRLLSAGATLDEPLPFSRLTLTAQLELLSHPCELLWEHCVELNPLLAPWREAAASGGLELASGQAAARQALSAAAYAQRFADVLAAPVPAAIPAERCEQLQADFMRERLQERNLYPLLWSSET